MNKGQPTEFGEKFANKLIDNAVTTAWRNPMEPERDYKLTDDEGGLMSNMIQQLLAQGLDEKEMISAMLEQVVENIEAVVDVVDVFHLIAAHRDMPTLSDVVPFELAQEVGYSYGEYDTLCNEMDERINEVLEIAIDQMIGSVAAENTCF